jgi:hypothetical protein
VNVPDRISAPSRGPFEGAFAGIFLEEAEDHGCADCCGGGSHICSIPAYASAGRIRIGPRHFARALQKDEKPINKSF